jgi:hypothetical protein
MRIGAAQDVMTDGAGRLPIMTAGGWKSMNVIGRSVENAALAGLGPYRRRAQPDARGSEPARTSRETQAKRSSCAVVPNSESEMRLGFR